jgi:hypothetical protein
MFTRSINATLNFVQQNGPNWPRILYEVVLPKRKWSEPGPHHFLLCQTGLGRRCRTSGPVRRSRAAGSAPPGPGCQGSSRGAVAEEVFFVGQGRFVRKNCGKFYFQGRIVRPWKWRRFVANLPRMFCPRTALFQGPFCPRDISLQNFWDEKSIGRFVRGRFVRVPLEKGRICTFIGAGVKV